MINKFQMSVEDNVEFAKRQIVDSIYKEARVEGINVTFPETQQIYDGFLVNSLSYEDTTKIINLKHAWFFVFDSLEYPFDLRYLRHINAIIETNLIRNAGVVRNISVRISGTDWIPEIPSPEKINREINRIRQIENPTDRSLELMLSVMRGQYFEDGNKRTAQLVANHEMISNGCGIISVPVGLKAEFSSLLVDYYESDDSKRIKEFLYDSCISGFSREYRLSDKEIAIQREKDAKAIDEFLKKKGNK